ncbi:MAG TPA: class II aldolase/adducin family protein [Spirochaetes bacterium]|nr:class II aldolase/adducin family protein [Spirochaetota bacterium]
MYKEERKEIIKSALKLVKYDIVRLSAGNLSIKCGNQGQHIVITPSGMDYEEINEKDLIVLNMKDKEVVEGFRRPSVDIDALIHIYENMSEVNAIIHTHQVYATCLGVVFDKLPSVVTTLANATGGEVAVAPFSSAASLEMGKETVSNIGDKKAVVLKNHGVITVGKTMKEALYSAVYLEDAAKVFCIAMTLGKPALLTEEQTREAAEIFKTYGQEKA